MTFQRILAIRHRVSYATRGIFISPSAQILGWRNVSIGRNSVISDDCWINVNNRQRGRTAIDIGENVFIGRRNFFSPGSTITIGAYVLTGIDCRFMGADHVFKNPFTPYIATGVTDYKAISVGANCWLGAGVTVMGGVTIGYGSVVGAGALVTKSMPPFSLILGSPARVVKRFDVASDEWIPAQLFDDEHEDRIPTASDYLMKLAENAPMIRMPIVAAGRSQGDLA